jgi:hypothetical protein
MAGEGWDLREQKKTSLYVPCAERPMIPVHCVGKLARFGTSQGVAQEAVRVESKSVRARNGDEERSLLVSIERSEKIAKPRKGKGRVKSLRVGILVLVVMDFVAVENERRVLRYVHPIVHKVLSGKVRCR